MDYYGDINIYGNNSKIHLNCEPNINNPFNGLVCHDYIDADVTYGDIVYFNLSSKLWKKSCANNVDTLPARGISCADFVNFSVKTTILLYGFFYWDTNPETISQSQLWLSDSIPGRFTNLKPSTIKNYVQVLGMAKTPSIYFFDFCPFYIKIG